MTPRKTLRLIAVLVGLVFAMLPPADAARRCRSPRSRSQCRPAVVRQPAASARDLAGAARLQAYLQQMEAWLQRGDEFAVYGWLDTTHVYGRWLRLIHGGPLAARKSELWRVRLRLLTAVEQELGRRRAFQKRRTTPQPPEGISFSEVLPRAISIERAIAASILGEPHPAEAASSADTFLTDVQRLWEENKVRSPSRCTALLTVEYLGLLTACAESSGTRLPVWQVELGVKLRELAGRWRTAHRLAWSQADLPPIHATRCDAKIISGQRESLWLSGVLDRHAYVTMLLLEGLCDQPAAETLFDVRLNSDQIQRHIAQVLTKFEVSTSSGSPAYSVEFFRRLAETPGLTTGPWRKIELRWEGELRFISETWETPSSAE